ncbi:aromatic-ring hydroxylase C-terminal domain-containing protein [Nonomuraea sp. ZG12]|uniref:aromatic-ring hydroxylase C-terminal domain-containing protein n=1 Tax=Nonomuraea sp. ZG12 TaxID=3452207 RepID=UPI003F88712C
MPGHEADPGAARPGRRHCGDPVGGLLREGRELLLDLVDRAEVRDATAAWTGRVNTVTARTDRVDVDALLIRPDGCVAWALPTGQDLDATTLVRALGTWIGQPA